MSTDPNAHALALGKILANLQSLEFALRIRLCDDDDPSVSFSPGIRLQELVVGQHVPTNSLTNYEALGALIDRYNAHLNADDTDLRVDRTLVDLRDALAHGRVSSATLDDDYVLLKFQRPSGDTTEVSYSQRLTPDWLAEQVSRLAVAIRSVNSSMQRHRERRGVVAKPVSTEIA